MDEVNARTHAIAEMRKWGLFEGTRPWKFSFNNRKRALGLCAYKRRTIYLSKYFLQKVSNEETLDTIRHEIAHALEAIRFGTGGHGDKWKAIAREVGAKPERTCDAPIQHSYTYVLKHGDRVVKGYFRLPKTLLKRLPTLGLRGRPETKGTLKLFRLVYN